MKRVALVVFVGFWVIALGWLMIVGGKDYRTTSAPPLDAGADATEAAAAADAGTADAAQVDDEDAGEIDEEDAGAEEAGDAGPIPDLGAAPKSIRFGLVLVRYKGAEATPPKTRSKEEARKLAEELAKLAKEDFAEAVKKGDHPGSYEDAGRMYRDILLPRIEYELFRLEKEQVSGVISTPRGFWIVRRIK